MYCESFTPSNPTTESSSGTEMPSSHASRITAMAMSSLEHMITLGCGRSFAKLKDPNYTVTSLAAKAGKSKASLRGRIKLSDLIPSIADAFLADRIAIGHALLIAKLPENVL